MRISYFFFILQNYGNWMHQEKTPFIYLPKITAFYSKGEKNTQLTGKSESLERHKTSLSGPISVQRRLLCFLVFFSDQSAQYVSSKEERENPTAT